MNELVLTSAERAVLGAALRARVNDVIGHMRALTRDSGLGLDPAVDDTVGEAACATTAALADWVSNGDTDAVREGDIAAADKFAQLAAHGETAVNEMVKQCLRWRDSAASILLDEAERLEVSRSAIREALLQTLKIFDLTLVRVCDAYEDERQRMMDELSSQRDELEVLRAAPRSRRDNR